MALVEGYIGGALFFMFVLPIVLPIVIVAGFVTVVLGWLGLLRDAPIPSVGRVDLDGAEALAGTARAEQPSKGTPKNIIMKLNSAAVDALADAAVRERVAGLGTEVFPREQQTPGALAVLQKAEIEKWWPIIKAAGIKAE
jgi:Tripartite tricarboxylate transporter family receptor